MKFRFILFIAIRYFKAKRKSRKIASSILSVIGISVGVMTLVVVIAVMNGFQLSFINPILEVKSYDIQIKGKKLTSSTLSSLEESEHIILIVPFSEMQMIAGLSQPCIVRGIAVEKAEKDSGFMQSFDPEYDKPDRRSIEEPGTIIIGSQLASQLNLWKGDTISLITISGSFTNKLSPQRMDFLVSGVFKTGFLEIDMSWAFISLDTIQHFNIDTDLIYGVKLKDRFNDGPALSRIEKVLASEQAPENEDSGTLRAQSWRNFNRVFFGALFTEKSSMMVLIGLIFIVVGFNIFHSLRRAVSERLDEIALLKALGASTRTIQGIFISEGFFIGFLGSMFGMILGLFVASNINPFFEAIEHIVNNLLSPVAEGLLRPFFKEISIASVSIFSPSIFYIDKVPIHVFLHEGFLITLFAMLCSSIAAFFAARSVTWIKPSVLLRYE